VKQYGVRDFVRHLPKTPVTLMTPEPTGGLYCEEGVAPFLARFGYADGLNADIGADGAVVGLDIEHASQNLDLATLETQGLPIGRLKAA
jgi:hypothetical protein